MEKLVFEWVGRYGYAALSSLLVLGIVGLPVPDETLLTFTGYLVYRGQLKFVPAVMAAVAGSVCGITISYMLGRTFGLALLHRYGRYIHVTEEDLKKAHNWFERVGRWSLTVGYYIPGVRHFTAYAAGISELQPHEFAAFAWSGAVIWSLSFITLGYFLGDRWDSVSEEVHRVLLWGFAAMAALMIGVLVWHRLRRRAKRV